MLQYFKNMNFLWKKNFVRIIPLLVIFVVIMFSCFITLTKTTKMNSLKLLFKGFKGNKDVELDSQISLKDVFFSIKTSRMTEQRMDLLLQTWLPRAMETTSIISDRSSLTLKIKTNHKVRDTGCGGGHTPDGLVCKMAAEFDSYLEKLTAWWCHFDDDMYVNIDVTLRVLGEFDADKDDVYIGRQSLADPITVGYKGKTSPFRFAHGGCGFCVSRKLAMKMKPFVAGSNFEKLNNELSHKINDDCLIGFVVTHILQVNLVESNLFNSHYHHKELRNLTLEDLPKQVSLSYSKNLRVKITEGIETKFFDVEEDPSRFYTVRCMLHPTTEFCH